VSTTITTAEQTIERRLEALEAEQKLRAEPFGPGQVGWIDRKEATQIERKRMALATARHRAKEAAQETVAKRHRKDQADLDAGEAALKAQRDRVTSQYERELGVLTGRLGELDVKRRDLAQLEEREVAEIVASSPLDELAAQAIKEMEQAEREADEARLALREAERRVLRRGLKPTPWA
jgi:hypothetical protein